MKHFYFLCLVFVFNCSWSQRTVQLGVLPPNGGLINITPNRNQDPAVLYHPKQKNNLSVAAANGFISSSELATGAINSHNQPLQYNKDLNLLTYFCNKSNSYTSSSNSNKGNIVCYYSTNNGVSWDSTLIYSNANYYASLVGGGIYNPIGNTNPANARLVSAAPLNNDTNWVGNFYASKAIAFPGNNSNSADVQTILNKNLPFGGLQKHHYAYSDFSVTEDGTAHAIGELLKDPMATTNLQYGYRGAAILKGVFSAGAFVWTSDSLIPNTKLRADGSKYLHHQAMTAWNNAGTVGYVVFNGVAINGINSSNTFQPIIYKTTNSGATWIKLPLMCFYTYAPAGPPGCFLGPLSVNNIEAISTNTNLIKPFFSMKEGSDVTVDMNNNLRIFSYLVSASSNHPDSLDYIYSYTPEKYSFKYYPNAYPTLWDLYTTSTGYGLIKIDSMGTEGPSGMISQPGYTTNVWDDGKGGKLSINARLQISRSYDGGKLFYSWTESDSTVTGHKWNIYPDVKFKGYDLNLQKLTQRMDATNSLFFATQQGYFHYMAPIVKNLTSNSWNIPIVFSFSSNTSSMTAASPIHNYHIPGLNFIQSSFSINTQIGTCIATSMIENKGELIRMGIFPNPSSEKIVVELKDFSDRENYELVITNSLGQEIRKIKITGIETEITGLTSGLYFIDLFKKGMRVGSEKVVVTE